VGISRTKGLLYWPWQPLEIPFVGAPLGQLYQSSPLPIPGDLGRGPSHQFVCLFVCCYKPQKSLLHLPPWARSSSWEYIHSGSASCRPIKGTPPPRTTLRANWGQHSTSWQVGSYPLTYSSPIQTHPQPPTRVPRSPSLVPSSANTQGRLVPWLPIRDWYSREWGWEKGGSGNPWTLG